MTLNVEIKIQIVNSFLLEIKKVADQTPDSFIVRSDREKNEQTMLDLGYKDKHVIEEILGLTYKNYSEGPFDNTSPDGPNKGFIWVFGKNIGNLEIYIKIHLVPLESETKCVCISFHEAEFPIKYPLK